MNTSIKASAKWTPWTRWVQYACHRSRRKTLMLGSLEIGVLTQFDIQQRKAHSKPPMFVGEFNAKQQLARLPPVGVRLGLESMRPFSDVPTAMEFVKEYLA